MNNIPHGLCQCGCGQETSLASTTLKKRGWVKGEPLRYISGHNNNWAGHMLDRMCKRCGSTFQAPLSRVKKGAARYCSRFCADDARRSGGWISNQGYNRTKIDGQTITVHRYIMEQHLGRTLEPHEDVHHINGDKLDNRIENLRVMDHAEHTRYHRRQRGGVEI